jgi:hypothetical protein
MKLQPNFRPNLGPKLLKARPIEATSKDSDQVELSSPGKTRIAGKEVTVQPTSMGTKVAVGVALASGTLIAANVVSQIASAGSLGGILANAALAGGTAVAAYLGADLASGIFHHAVDNYAKPGNSALGHMASEFQAHHYFANSMDHVTAVGTTDPMVKLVAPILAATAVFDPHFAVATGSLAFFGGALLGQASHRYTHQAQPPAFVQTLRKFGIAQEKDDHLEHHHAPWASNYCILNGAMNGLLDRTDFWRKWERGVHAVTGLEPKTWNHPAIKDFALGKIDKAEYQRRYQEEIPTFKQNIGFQREREEARAYIHAKG